MSLNLLPRFDILHITVAAKSQQVLIVNDKKDKTYLTTVNNRKYQTIKDLENDLQNLKKINPDYHNAQVGTDVVRLAAPAHAFEVGQFTSS